MRELLKIEPAPKQELIEHIFDSSLHEIGNS